ncbi:MAG: hypothetical protein K2N87_18900 [Eubacterium sp.]|nr:hypothetical protein [Eubacterium sp.]
MDVEKKLHAYGQQYQAEVKEEAVMDTILKSKKLFYEKECEKMLSYTEFLWSQFCIVRKRWWLCQILLLTGFGSLLSYMEELYYIRRSMGITAVLFIVLAIPELWKNRTCHCMEVETAAFYSLRQIYAARILLFGIVDLILLAVFCMVLHGQLYLTFTEILIQFLFPMAVTACICFGILCSPYVQSEVTAAACCMVWSAVWWMITLQDQLYAAVMLPVWVCLSGIAGLCLAGAVYRAVHSCSRCLELQPDRS